MKSTTRRSFCYLLVTVCLSVAVTFLASSAASAATPPKVVSSTATPSPVHAGSQVTFTWQFTSSAGVNFATLFARGPKGTLLPNCGGPGDSLFSGTANAGTYQQVCNVPTTAANGQWTTTIQMQDGAGNTISPAGPTFTVTGGTAATPPKVVSSTVTPSPVNAGSQVTFTWQFTSSAGVNFATLFARGPKGTILPNCGGPGDSLFSGTANAGTYQQVCNVPTTAANGQWTTTIQMQDGAGNTISPAGPTFTVTGGTAAGPPKVVSSTATPSPVNAGSQVTFTWQFTSSAGVNFATLFARGPNGTILPNCGGPGDSLFSGTANAGTYQQVCNVPSTVDSGRWTTTIQMEDGAGNTISPAGPTFTVGAETVPSVSPTASTYGETVSYSVHIRVQSGTPTGTVSFGIGNTHLCTTGPLSLGTGSCRSHAAPGGPDQITATYSGDANFAAATGTTTLAVFKASTSTSLTVRPTIATFGRSVTYSARVASPAGTPSGSVAFTSRGDALCTASLTEGAGRCVASSSPPGANAVTATYSGDNNFDSSAATRTATVLNGYWLVSSDGGVFAFGNAGFHGSMGGHRLNEPVVGMASTPDGNGYWLVSSDGGVFAFGNAGFHGSMGGHRLNEPVVGMASTPDGGGYWLVSSDGGVFAFGNAGFHGSMGGHRLNEPVVGMASTPDGGGYWLVSSDGGVFAFGNAGFHGAARNRAITSGVKGIASSNALGAYWITNTAGSVAAYGRGANFGSVDAPLTVPIVGITAAPNGAGYALATSTGGVFVFGDCVFEGSMAGRALTEPVVGIASL